jgi:hypothetical protein
MNLPYIITYFLEIHFTNWFIKSLPIEHHGYYQSDQSRENQRSHNPIYLCCEPRIKYAYDFQATKTV